ncbi:hypothetical protein [Micromonospora sp. NPDC023956]
MPNTPDRDLLTRNDYDFVDFDERDARDEHKAQRVREVVFGLPARPGTRR